MYTYFWPTLICRIPNQLTLSRNSPLGFDVVGEEWNSQILVNCPLPVYQGTPVAVKTLGLKCLQLPDMGARNGPADGARVVHQWTDELLIHQNSVSDGQTTRHV